MPSIKVYCQKDKKWADKKLGKSILKIGDKGCLLCCLGMLSGRDPLEADKILTRANAYTPTGLIIHSYAKTALGLKFDGVSYNKNLKPTFMTIMETDKFAPKVPQHFVLWLGDGTIADPLDGKVKKNLYRTTGWRLYRV